MGTHESLSVDLQRLGNFFILFGGMNHVPISVTNIYGTLNVSGPSDVSIQLLIQQRVFIKWRNAWEASDAMSRSG
ncbi:hypothetical protein S83_068102 [Arachis hypogaea]